jgi:hypothetical protein
MDRQLIKSRLGEYLEVIGIEPGPGGMIRCPFHGGRYLR